MPRNTAVKKHSPQNKTRKPDSSRVREKLMEAGKKLFARQGLSGTSIRDIAQHADVNSSMISYYFNGKEGLYKECLKEIGQTRLNFAKEVFTEAETEEEFRVRLQMFMSNFFGLYLEDKDAGLIIVREYERTNSPAERVFKDTFLRIFDLLVEFFKSAQKKGIVHKNRDPFVLASLFFGCLSSQMQLDHLKEKIYQRSIKDKSEQKKVIAHLIDLFIVQC